MRLEPRGGSSSRIITSQQQAGRFKKTKTGRPIIRLAHFLFTGRVVKDQVLHDACAVADLSFWINDLSKFNQI
jgi:hypothetical protein